MHELFLDIETIPTQLPGYRDMLRENLRAPATYKKPESIEKWLAENGEERVEELYRKTSFDGGVGSVVVIGAAIDDEPVHIFSNAHGASEREIIATFTDWVEQATANKRLHVIGHHVAAFDLTFLMRRALVLDVALPKRLPTPTKSWDNNVTDTMAIWSGGSRGGYHSLEDILVLTGVGRKGVLNGYEFQNARPAGSPQYIEPEDMHGSLVWDIYQDGGIETIAEYCANDVDQTRAFYRRAQRTLNVGIGHVVSSHREPLPTA